MGASASTGKHHIHIMNQLAEAWKNFYEKLSHHERANEALKKEAQSANPNPDAIVAASEMAGEAHQERHKAAQEISKNHAKLEEAVGKKQAEEGNKMAKAEGKKAAETGKAPNSIDMTGKVENALRFKLEFA